jgi:hypothetical protein
MDFWFVFLFSLLVTLLAEMLAKSPPSRWAVKILTQRFPSLLLGRTGLVYLAPLALF